MSNLRSISLFFLQNKVSRVKHIKVCPKSDRVVSSVPGQHAVKAKRGETTCTELALVNMPWRLTGERQLVPSWPWSTCHEGKQGRDSLYRAGPGQHAMKANRGETTCTELALVNMPWRRTGERQLVLSWPWSTYHEGEQGRDNLYRAGPGQHTMKANRGETTSTELALVNMPWRRTGERQLVPSRIGQHAVMTNRVETIGTKFATETNKKYQLTSTYSITSSNWKNKALNQLPNWNNKGLNCLQC